MKPCDASTRRADGSLVEDEDEIMAKIGDLYEEIYAQDE